MTKQSFIRGTFILIIAGFINRILGFINRVVVARIMGSEGVGLYMMAFPTLILAITITQLGLPIAISKLIAEAQAVHDHRKTKKILVVSLATTGILSIIFTIGLMILAPVLANTLLTDKRTLYPLLAILPVIPIVAISGVLKGYFQGKQDMKPSAIAQVLEQIVRITLIAVCTKTFMPYGVEFAAAGAMLSSVIGEFIALAYLFYVFKRKKRITIHTHFFNVVRQSKDTFNELMRIALPTTGSRLVGSVSTFLEPIIVAQSLALAGVTSIMATKQYGILTGYVLPLLLLPSFVTFALSTSLVPAISESVAKKQWRAVEYRLQQSMRIALVSGGWSVIILYVFGTPLMELMYKTTEGANFIKLLAPLFLFYYFQGPLQAVLQALDLANAAMINSIVSSVIKFAVIFFFASNPAFGIDGVALGIAASVISITILHYFTVLKKITFTIYIREYLLAIIAIALSGGIGYYLFTRILFSDVLAIQTIITIFVTTFVYIGFLIAFRLIKREDLSRLPIIRTIIK
ncbi:MAG: stage V sporulation protein B [Bacillaceae bacterium]